MERLEAASICSAATGSTRSSTCTRTSTTKLQRRGRAATGPCAPTISPGGAGAPNWSRNYASPGLNTAEEHFWQNDVVGQPAGRFDRYGPKWPPVSGATPGCSATTPSTSRTPGGRRLAGTNPVVHVDTELECFYTGRAHPGLDRTGTPRPAPRRPARRGLIPTIETPTPRVLVFVEPVTTTTRACPNTLGPMDFPVSSSMSTTTARCAIPTDRGTRLRCRPARPRLRERLHPARPDEADMATSEQPRGPLMFLTEFGATSDRPICNR